MFFFDRVKGGKKKLHSKGKQRKLDYLLFFKERKRVERWEREIKKKKNERKRNNLSFFF